MEFKHLQSFAAVVKCGSFTKAAELLYLSQPTISSHISALESELDCLLIVRTTKSIEITPKGREVYEYVENILELRDRMIRSCVKDSQKILHLGASTIPSAYILPEVLPKFGQIHPDIYFVIHQSDSQGVIDGLMDGVYDIGLIGKTDERLTCIPFCSDRMIMITPVTERFLEMQQQEETPLEQLLREPIIWREEGSGNVKNAVQFLESIGMQENQLRVIARINDQEVIKNLVAGGLGISMISERAAHNFIEEKRLLKFELPVSNSRSLYLAYRNDRILQPQFMEFAGFIREWYVKRG